MTPAEQFAAKRLEAEQLIRQHAPARLQDQLIALLRPAIALTATRTDDAQIPVGTSKFGGAPDVPSDFVWPMWNEKPLGFLAQINLEEVAAFDLDGLLPKSGLLSFFYEWKGMPWGYELSHKGGGQVVWINQPIERTQDPNPISSQRVHPSAQWMIPETENEEINVALDEAEQEADEDESPFENFYELKHQMLESFTSIFGWPLVIQENMEAQCQAASNGFSYRSLYVLQEEGTEQIQQGVADWRFLAQFQFDEVTDGRLYFWIRKQDLRARRFDEAWVIYQTT